MTDVALSDQGLDAADARRWASALYAMVRAAVREVSVPDPDMDRFCERLEAIAQLSDDLREAVEGKADAGPWRCGE